MGLFRKSDGAETAGATCAALVGPGNAGCEDQGEGEPRTKPHSSEAQYYATWIPETRGPRWPSSYPGRVPVLTEVSSLEGGPGEWCQHSVQLEAHLPGWRGWVKTKPLSGLEAQAWPSLEVESKT